MARFYILDDGEITAYVEGRVAHEWGDSYRFYPDEGYSLIIGEKLFDPVRYMIYTVEEDCAGNSRSCSIKPEDGTPTDIDELINNFESRPEDAVDHPAHYDTGRFECIDVMIETQGVEAVIDFCICNGFKYIYRHKNKNGIEDLKKARWYLDKAIELTEGGNAE